MLCPFCKEAIPDGALRCAHCHATLGGAQNRPGPDGSAHVGPSAGAWPAPGYDTFRSFFAGNNLKYVFLSWEGRLNRAKYWAAVGILVGAQILALTFSPWLYGLVCVACVYPGLVVGIKRFHDLDKSGHWMWFSLVPLLNIYTAILAMCVRGARGPNRFGPDLLP
jgi:uncharacterized membrane protein YhaH (DUF805 family)